MDDPTTHHPECYREHHACAVARLDRPREALDEAEARIPPNPAPMLDLFRTALVAVRDITEGR